MDCCNTNAITLVRGNDTDFNGQHLLTLHLTSEVLDLSDLKASFTLVDVEKTYDDLTSGTIIVDYSASETAEFPIGIIYGDLKVESLSGKIATIENRIPFKVVSVVHGDSIAVKPYEYTINVEQGGENILNISVEAGVSVEVGATETLPPNSPAYVQNVGTANHLKLNFGIPQGEKGEEGEQGPAGKDGSDGKDATINGRNAIILAAGTGIAISDNQGTVTISNTQTSAEWGNITGTLSNQYDLQQVIVTLQNNIDGKISPSDLVAVTDSEIDAMF